MKRKGISYTSVMSSMAAGGTEEVRGAKLIISKETDKTRRLSKSAE